MKYNTWIVAYVMLFIIGSIFGINPYLIIILISFNEIIKQINKERFFSALVFWNIGFILLSCSTNYFEANEIIERFGFDIYNKTAFLFFVSQITVLFFYHYFITSKVNFDIKVTTQMPKQKLRVFTVLIILFIYLIFIFYNGKRALDIISLGRGTFTTKSSFGGQGEQGLDRSLISTLLYYLTEISGYILPTLILIVLANKLKPLKALLTAFFLSVPLWVIQFMLGTRHHILLSGITLLACFALIYHKTIKVKVKTFLLILSCGIIFSVGMLHIRKVGYKNIFDFSKLKLEPEKIAGDPSGRYMNYVVDYYSVNSYRYGTSSLGLVFIWVPRSVWNNKPKGFTHWFLREHVIKGYKGYNSISCSYLAIPYSDFGYIGVLFLSFLIAYFLFKIDRYMLKVKQINSYRKLIFIAFTFSISFYMSRALTAVYLKLTLVFVFLIFISIINKLVAKQTNEPNIKKIK